MKGKFRNFHYELVSLFFSGVISGEIGYGLIDDPNLASIATWMMTGLLFFLLEAMRSVVNGTWLE